MKKLIALLLALVMVASMMVACGKTEKTNETTKPNIVVTEDALTVFNNIWAAYPEADKFPCYGGDAENMTNGEPGVYSDMESLNAQLLVPEDQFDNITEVVSLFHGMMLNNFTCAVYKMAEGADAEAFTATMETALKDNQWMCGCPDQMVIAVIDDGAYVLVGYGLSEVMSKLSTAMNAAYPYAEMKSTGSVVQ